MVVSETGLLVERADDVLRLRIHRPRAHNAFTSELARELIRRLERAEEEQTLRTIVLAGDAHWFCTGLDLDEALGDVAERRGVDEVFKKISTCERLVVAEVEGLVAAGGVGLCAACDIVVAGPRARFQLPEILWGLCPAVILPWLVERVGKQKAREMMLTARTLTAADAHRIHLVDVLSDEPARAVDTICRRNARVPLEGLRASKRYLNRQWSPSPETLTLARDAHVAGFSEPATRERLRAFVERDRASWGPTHD